MTEFCNEIRSISKKNFIYIFEVFKLTIVDYNKIGGQKVGKRRDCILLGVIMILLLFHIEAVSAAAITWHFSVKKDRSWKWKITNYTYTNYSKRIGEILFYLGNLEEGLVFEITTVDDPPTVGSERDLRFQSNVSWADIYTYRNGNRVEEHESLIYFFIAPLTIGSSTGCEVLWIDSIDGYVNTYGTPGNYEKYPGANSTKYEITASGGSEPYREDYLEKHEITYNHTGFLEKYVMTLNSTSRSNMVEIKRVTYGLFTTTESDKTTTTSAIPGLSTTLALGTLVIFSKFRLRLFIKK